MVWQIADFGWFFLKVLNSPHCIPAKHWLTRWDSSASDFGRFTTQFLKPYGGPI